MRSRDQGKQLAYDRIGRLRPGQAAFEKTESVAPFTAFDGDPTQVEQDEWLVRPFLKLALQNRDIARELPESPMWSRPGRPLVKQVD